VDGAGRAAALRGRLHELGEQRRLLVGSLREHTEAVAEHTRAAREHIQAAATHADGASGTRRELYGLIAALAAVADEADGIDQPSDHDEPSVHRQPSIHDDARDDSAANGEHGVAEGGTFAARTDLRE